MSRVRPLKFSQVSKTVASASLLAIAAFAGKSYAQTTTISVDFQARDNPFTLAPGDTAGVVPATNWNTIGDTGGTGGGNFGDRTFNALNTSSGNTSVVSLSVRANDSWHNGPNPGAGGSADAKMMYGVEKLWGNDDIVRSVDSVTGVTTSGWESVFSFGGLDNPASTETLYDLYAYYGSDGGQNANFSLQNAGATQYRYVDMNNGFGGTYTQGLSQNIGARDGLSSNYVKFSDLEAVDVDTNPNDQITDFRLTLRMNNAGLRSRDDVGIAGFQLVARLPLGPTRIWRGNNGSTWDTTTPNWGNGTQLFPLQGEAVFGDGADSFIVQVAAGGIQPGSVTFDNSIENPYILNAGGAITGTGTFTKKGAGKLTIAGTNNSFSGAVDIQNGTVRVEKLGGGADDGALGRGSLALGSAGKTVTLEYGGAGETANRSLAINGPVTIKQNATGALVVGGVVSGNGTLVKTGAQTLQFSSVNNSFSGGIDLQEGTMRVSSLGNGSGNTLKLGIAAGGSVTFGLDGNLTSGRNVTVAAPGATIDVSGANTATFTGTLAATGALAKTGTGTLNVTNTATFAAPVSLAAGRTQFSGATTFNSTVSIAGVARFTGTASFNSVPVIEDGGTLSLRRAAGNNIPGAISVGTGRTLEAVPGALGVSGANPNAVNLSGGSLVLSSLGGLNGQFFAENPQNVNGINPAFASRADYTAFFSTRTPTVTANTSDGGVEVLDYTTRGDVMYAPYNFNNGDNIISRMAGKIFVPTAGNYTFTTASDDGSVLFINGASVVNNNFFQGVTARSGSVALNAGFHDIDIGFYEGGGGNGLRVEWAGPGFGNQLLSNSVLSLSDQGVVFANPINVSGASTINVATALVNANSLNIAAGSTLTVSGNQLTASPVLQGTAAPGTEAYNINVASTFVVNNFSDGGEAVAITKGGAGVLVLDPQVAHLQNAGSSIRITDGAVGLILGGTQVSTGNAQLVFEGGGVVLTSKAGNQSYAIPSYTGNAIFEARKLGSGVAGTAEEPINVTLTGNLNLGAANNTVRLGTADNYTLSVGGAASGAGTIVVSGGDIRATTNNALNGSVRFANALPATVKLQTSAPVLGTLSSSSTGATSIVVGDSNGPATLTIGNSTSGIFRGTIAPANGSTVSLVKTGTGTQTLSLANPGLSGVTVQAGILELNHIQAGGDGTLSLDGGTIRIATQGLGLKIYNSNPGTSNAYGGDLSTFAGVLAHYARIGAPTTTTNTAANGVTVIDFPGNGQPTDAAPYAIFGNTQVDNIEAIMSGSIFIPSAGDYRFAPRSDDGTTVYIDGQLIVNNNFGQGIDSPDQPSRDRTVALTAGYHQITITHNEGGGGAGVFVNITGTDNVTRRLNNNELFSSDVTLANSVAISDKGGTIDLVGGTSSLGPLTWNSGSVGDGSTFTTTAGSVKFASTTLLGTDTFVIAGSGNVDFGPIQDGGAAVTINKTSTSDLFLTNTASAQFNNAATLLNVSGGRLVAVGSSAPGALSPLGQAGVQLSNGAGLGLSSTGGNVAFASAVTITGNASITAGNFGGGGVDGAIDARLTSPVSFGANNLTLKSANGYTLTVANTVTGTGALIADGGTVNVSGAVNSGTVTVTSGTLNALNTLTASADITVNAGALNVSGTTNSTGGKVLVNGGAGTFQQLVTATGITVSGGTANFAAGVSSPTLDVTGGTATMGGSSFTTPTTVSQNGTLAFNPGAGATATVSNLSVNGGTVVAQSGILDLSTASPTVTAPVATVTGVNVLSAKLHQTGVGGSVLNPTNEAGIRDALARPTPLTTQTGGAIDFFNNAAADNAIGALFGLAAGQNGNRFTAAWTGLLNVPANIAAGQFEFQVGAVDDFGAAWIDLNQNGAFETNGSAGNELVSTMNCCGDGPIGAVDLVAGQSYRVAFALEDTGGDSGVIARIRLPGETTLTPVNPALQTGLFSTARVDGGLRLRAESGADLKLGSLTGILDLVLNGGGAKATITQAGTVPILNASGNAGATGIIDVGADLLVSNLTVDGGSRLTKTGLGVLTTSAQSIGSAGEFAVDAGTVVFNGTGGASNGATTGLVSVNNSATVQLNGSIRGSININGTATLRGTGFAEGIDLNGTGVLSPGAVSPGSKVGSISTTNLNLNGGSLALEISSATAYDQIKVSDLGVVTLNADTPFTLALDAGYTPSIGTVFSLIDNAGTDGLVLPGGAQFVFGGNRLDDGEIFDVGAFSFEIDYAGGPDFNDVTLLVVVPEPGTMLTLLSGMGMLAGLQRFRRRRA